MNALSLDDIRAAVEEKYVSMPVLVGDTEVRLMNALRLPKDRRDKVQALQSRMDSEGEDQAEILRDVIRYVAETPKQAKVLIDAVGDDLALLAEIFSQYGKLTQPGEASDSHS